MSAPRLVTARTEVTTECDQMNWQKDFASSEDRLDPYKHIGLIRSNQNEEILRAVELLQRNGYDVYRRK